MAIDKEQIDRAIDMLEKVKTLADTKGFDFKGLLQKHSTQFKSVPTVKLIKSNPEEYVPIVIAEMRSLIAIINKR